MKQSEAEEAASCMKDEASPGKTEETDQDVSYNCNSLTFFTIKNLLGLNAGTFCKPNRQIVLFSLLLGVIPMLNGKLQ